MAVNFALMPGICCTAKSECYNTRVFGLCENMRLETNLVNGLLQEQGTMSLRTTGHSS